MRLFDAQRHAWGRAFSMAAQRPGAFLLGSALAAAALALPLTLASLGWASWPVLARVQPAAEISVFVTPRASARQVDALRERLARLPQVASVVLKPRDAALADLAKRSGFTLDPADLGGNPLPDVLIARFAPTVPAATIDAHASAVRGWSEVDAVRSDLDWYRKLGALGRVALIAAVVFGSLVLVLVALILLGTIRLHAAARADEITVLHLLGATRRFIVRPYAYSAMLTMMVAAAVATAVVYGAHAALRGPIGELTGLYGASFQLADPEPAQVLAVIVIAAAFGWSVGVIGARATLGLRGD